MKTASVILTVASFAFGLFRASADLEVSAAVQIHAKTDFYEPLAAHGTWIEVGSYGRCWHPAHVAVEWRPYAYGSWVWTDCGWYWASDEPWAWACYHYGNWVYDSSEGWMWVPGLEWAPAWVYWRTGGGFIGWAPFPPHGVIVEPARFVFVDVHRFREPLRPATLIVNNTTIVNKTTLLTELKRENKTLDGSRQQVLVNNGPGVDVIQKATGKTVSALPIRDALRQTPVPAVFQRGASEATGKDKPAAGLDQSTAGREPRVAPAPTPGYPNPGHSKGREGKGRGKDKF